jgi:membrane associated rhomboid family serine protease
VDGAQVYFSLGCTPYEITRLTDIGPTALVPIPLTLLTSIFLHGGWIHLLGNMLFLWIFGDNVEGRLGHFRYLLFFLVSGAAATLVQIAFQPGSRVPIVGASGAIAAVMALYLVFFPTAKVKTVVFWFIFFQIIRIPAFVFLGYWIALQVIIGFAHQGSTAGGVAWFAHIGGFALGLIVAFYSKVKRKK